MIVGSQGLMMAMTTTTTMKKMNLQKRRRRCKGESYRWTTHISDRPIQTS